MFVTAPSYVVGGSISLRLFHHNSLLLNLSLSFPPPTSPSWLPSPPGIRSVYNPHLLPPPKHSHEEDCRLRTGCAYNVRGEMRSWIVQEGTWKIESENDESVVGSPFRNDESMRIYASNLTLLVDSLQVLESAALAEQSQAHDRSLSPQASHTRVESEDEWSRHPKVQTFISPDILIEFHQYQLSPMQHVGVQFIMKGAAIILVAGVMIWIRRGGGERRSKDKNR